MPSKVATGTFLTPLVWRGQVSNPRPPAPEADAIGTGLLGILVKEKSIKLDIKCNRVYVYLTTLLTSPIEFSVYFQSYVRYLNKKFSEGRKIYETGLRDKIMGVNIFYKVPQTIEQSNPYFQKSQKSID